MTKIIMLGTGAGGTLDLYNTCFVIQNLILYHTEETHGDMRKELYEEAQSVFDGNVYVPNDLEEIKLTLK